MADSLDGVKTSQAGDELIQQLLKDILSGLKKKMVQPVLEENKRIAERLEVLKAEDRP